MKQINTVNDLLSFIQLIKQQNKTIGIVPTMGSLHSGHDSLIKRCKKENNITIVSIYVNPKQFNNKNDFLNYPRTLDADINRLKTLNCDILFSPSDKEISKPLEIYFLAISGVIAILFSIFKFSETETIFIKKLYSKI